MHGSVLSGLRKRGTRKRSVSTLRIMCFSFLGVSSRVCVRACAWPPGVLPYRLRLRMSYVGRRIPRMHVILVPYVAPPGCGCRIVYPQVSPGPKMSAAPRSRYVLPQRTRQYVAGVYVSLRMPLAATFRATRAYSFRCREVNHISVLTSPKAVIFFFFLCCDRTPLSPLWVDLVC